MPVLTYWSGFIVVRWENLVVLMELWISERGENVVMGGKSPRENCSKRK